MKKTKGKYKVYLNTFNSWELSGNRGLHGKTFITKGDAVLAALKFGSEGGTYSVGVRPASRSRSFYLPLT